MNSILWYVLIVTLSLDAILWHFYTHQTGMALVWLVLAILSGIFYFRSDNWVYR